MKSTVSKIIDDALAEDLGGGDITSVAVVPKDASFQGVMTAREDMTIAGIDIALEVFAKIDDKAELHALVKDGDDIKAGTILATIKGLGRAMLTAERTALNLLQHLSGIATLGRAYARRISGTGAVLLDTRKTIPGLRKLAKYATRQGGVKNHRMRLDDGVLIKDNHIAVAGSVGEAVRRAKLAGLKNIEVECDTLDQVRDALDAGVWRLLLDNMDNHTLVRAVAMAKGQAETEASGGVNLDTIRAIAETGVDYISVGRITQSAPAVDIGLDWETDKP